MAACDNNLPRGNDDIVCDCPPEPTPCPPDFSACEGGCCPETRGNDSSPLSSPSRDRIFKEINDVKQLREIARKQIEDVTKAAKKAAQKQAEKERARKTLEMMGMLADALAQLGRDEEDVPDQFYIYGLSRDLGKLAIVGKISANWVLKDRIKDADFGPEEAAEKARLESKMSRLVDGIGASVTRLKRIALTTPPEQNTSATRECSPQTFC